MTYNSRRTHQTLFAGESLAEKLGGRVDLLSGQTKITESNIEDTLKVSELIFVLL